MKKITILLITTLLCVAGVFAQKKGAIPDTSKHTVFYTCPMHKDVKELKAGDCPKCGMKLKLSGKEQVKAAVTKNYTCPVHMDMVSHNPGQCPQCGKKLNLSPKEQMKAEAMKMYTCPMHADVSLDKNGKCPKCGKALVEKKN